MTTIWWSADGASLELERVSLDAASALGWTSEDWLRTRSLLAAVHPDDRAELERLLRSVVASLGHAERTLRFVGSDAQPVVLRVFARALQRSAEQRGIEGVLLHVQPGTEDLERLMAEHERVAAILDGTRAGTWEWNVQTGETVFNERWASMLGYTLAELAPTSLETWSTLTHPDDIERALREVERHFSGELDYYECEMRMRHRAGHWVWILDRGRIKTRTPDGRPQLVFGTHTDVSSAHRSADEARESARMLAGLARLQRDFLIEPQPRRSLDAMLEFLLEISHSAYGFIGEVHRRPDGTPFLKTHALTNIAWDDATRELFQRSAAQGLEFSNLHTLFGAVLSTRAPVLSNSPHSTRARAALRPAIRRWTRSSACR